jgi:hypothetical protein
LTQELNAKSTAISVDDVQRIVYKHTETAITVDSSGSVVAFSTIPNDLRTTKAFTIVNSTTGAEIDNSTVTLRLIDDRPAFVFESGVTAGDTVNLVVYLGKSVMIGTEHVYFNSIDLTSNTINGLIRGIDGTSIYTHSQYATIYGLNDYVMLDNAEQGVLWNEVTSTVIEPLQLSNTAAAKFLRN